MIYLMVGSIFVFDRVDCSLKVLLDTGKTPTRVLIPRDFAVNKLTHSDWLLGFGQLQNNQLVQWIVSALDPHTL